MLKEALAAAQALRAHAIPLLQQPPYRQCARVHPNHDFFTITCIATETGSPTFFGVASRLAAALLRSAGEWPCSQLRMGASAKAHLHQKVQVAVMCARGQHRRNTSH